MSSDISRIFKGTPQYSFVNHETIFDKVVNKVLSALGCKSKNDPISPFDPPSFFTKMCAFFGSKGAIESIKNRKIECVTKVYVVDPNKPMLVISAKAGEVFRKKVVAVIDQTGQVFYAKSKDISDIMPFTKEGRVKEWARPDYDQRFHECLDLLKFAPKEQINDFLSGIIKLGGKNPNSQYNAVYNDLKTFYESDYGKNVKKLDFESASNPSPASSSSNGKIKISSNRGASPRASYSERRGF
jgi:hypothetical protein